MSAIKCETFENVQLIIGQAVTPLIPTNYASLPFELKR